MTEDAVSPVIGVILMVAITIVLAAVIAAFVFGLPGNYESTKIVSLSIEKNQTHVSLFVNGGNDVLDCILLSHITTSGSVITEGDICAYPEIGRTYLIGEYQGGDSLSILGHFRDGSVQVITRKIL